MFIPDQLDLKILDLLQHNSRLTIKDLAAQLHRSTTPIFERIKRLEKEQFIQQYVAIVNPKKMGKNLYAYIDISLREHGKDPVEAFVAHAIQYEEVLECHHVSGRADFLLKVLVENMEAYNKFLVEKLTSVPNIGNVESRFCLSVRKQSTAIPF